MPDSQLPSFYRRAKRFGDIVGAALLLVLNLPLLLVTALLIVVESGRPVLFRQTRSGRDGVPFTLLKLRTLRPGAHDPGNPLSRVTRVGTVLRRWALDELPQLWNVLRGEMSLVGPRPTLPEQVAAYSAAERRRLAVRPGLTGWAQIHGRNALTWPERIRLDLWYVDHCSLRLDLYILLKTPFVLLAGTGVYGARNRNPDFPAGPDNPALPLGANDA